MKKTALSITFVAILFIQAFSQRDSVKAVNAPNFLVHNQLTAELLKVEYSGALSSGVFKSIDNRKARFKQNTFMVSGYPVALLSEKHRQLYLGFGYTRNVYTSNDTESAPGFLEETFHNANLNIFLNTRIKGKLYWFSYLQTGVQGSNPFEHMSTSHNEIFLNKINYKVKRNLNVGAGLVYVSNLGDPLILPAVTFVYSSRYYLINIDFPIKAEVEGILSQGRWRPVIGVLFPANTYQIKNKNEYVSTSGLTGYAGVRYRVLDFLYLYGAWQTVLSDSYRYGTRHNRKEIGETDQQSKFVISLSVQVARFIPEEK